MSTFSVVIVAAIIGLIIYFVFFRKRKEEIDNREMTIENVGPDGVIAVSNLGGRSLQVTITDKITHQEDNHFWFELEGETSEGDDFWLQIESIDPYVLHAGHIEIDFHELGKTLHEMQMLPIGQEVFQYEGETILLDSIGEVQAFNHDDEEDDFRWYKYWELSNHNKDLFVTVEHYEDEHPRVFVSIPLESHQIRIFDLGKNV